MPNLTRLGLGRAAQASTGTLPPGLEAAPRAEAIWGFGRETSSGKDTPSGHWEMAGVPVTFEWTYFPDTAAGVPEGAD